MSSTITAEMIMAAYPGRYTRDEAKVALRVLKELSARKTGRPAGLDGQEPGALPDR